MRSGSYIERATQVNIKNSKKKVDGLKTYKVLIESGSVWPSRPGFLTELFK